MVVGKGGDVARVGAEEEQKDRHYKSQRSQPRYIYTYIIYH